MSKHIVTWGTVALWGLVLAVPAGAAKKPAPAEQPPVTPTPSAETSKAPATPASADTMTLRGGESGTLFDDLTVEGEDRIRIEFDRPPLDLAIDPKSAPGLSWDRSVEVLDRSAPSAVRPLLAESAGEPCPYLGHPYFAILTEGPVARFTPQVEGVERWTLSVADSRGRTVATYRGTGKLPKEIAWDGNTEGGSPALPGLVYSYVFEAFDRAGNKRNFMGDGFEVRPYIRRQRGAMTILFTGKEIGSGTPGKTPIAESPILLETASRLNQMESVTQPITVEARARTFEQAKALADRVTAALRPRVLGDPTRIAAQTTVEPDAPEQGSILVAAGS
jgi:hypothetical protein